MMGPLSADKQFPDLLKAFQARRLQEPHQHEDADNYTLIQIGLVEKN